MGSDRFDNIAFQQLHCLWTEHAAHMDKNGRIFLKSLEDIHSKALLVRRLDILPIILYWLVSHMVVAGCCKSEGV